MNKDMSPLNGLLVTLACEPSPSAIMEQLDLSRGVAGIAVCMQAYSTLAMEQISSFGPLRVPLAHEAAARASIAPIVSKSG